MTGRRKFIKDSCAICLALAGTGSLSFLTAGCASLSVYKTHVEGNKITVPVSEVSPDEKYKIIRPSSMAYDILLVNNGYENYSALLMKCTHVGNPLVAGHNNLVCNFHGSTFDLRGQVTHGPATQPLEKFRAIRENNSINIYLN
jgi:Rieske Fe-S protein